MAQSEEEPERPTPEQERAAARARIEHQQTWVDLQVRQAMERGEFDNLAGAGQPIEGLGGTHDPDWWLKRLVERERIAVLPPALQLRKDDAQLDEHLDTLVSEREARAFVEDFNARVIRARYTPVDGPPLITMPRDVEASIRAWRERQAARRASRRIAATDAARAADSGTPVRRRWWRRAR
ncbi:hypothetical protein ASE01_05020 [Nocardioides sp. Root190]|uniref:DnaJ family domain-containing protein n=1 Tax=Nocardioides sp. Root190 TaxID=1736488 RepID=UPI0006F3B154|nr:DUF1992 domain-containing protein [Nocardioides sp. Root190]KRB78615.1 hypothetical protein ASE01_05020 [Nocardioides sp. Root190]